MAPSTEVVKVETETMLEESIGGFNSTLGSKDDGAGVIGESALGKDRGLDSAFGDLW